MINFEAANLAAGNIVTDQLEGITISTSAEHGVMIFDTNNPTGEDDDLAAEDLGNVLIISEDGDQDDPDDNATGGTIAIDFDEPSIVTKIGLLDIEEPGSFVSLFDAEGELIENIHIEPVGDGISFELDLPNSEVSRLELRLAGSGALTSLDLKQDDSHQDGTSSEVILLTETGWERDGKQLGTWSNNGDIVGDSVSRIQVPDDVTVDTLDGDDEISGLANNGIGYLSNKGAIFTGNGDDLLQGSVIGEGNDNIGILNDFVNRDDAFDFLRTNDLDVDQQVIRTEAGKDRIIGTVEIDGDGNSNRGVFSGTFSNINTGEDSDRLDGTVEVGGSGDFNEGVVFGSGFEIRSSQIEMGEGDDRITGTVKIEENGNRNSGITNISFNNLDTGSGNDEIIAEVEVGGNGDFNDGIAQGEGSINTGEGDDRIVSNVRIAGDGSSNRGISQGLSGIDLGAGDDYLFASVEVDGNGDDNIGIYNDFASSIRMGAGDDVIVGIGGDAYSGFGADVNDFGFIDLGEGEDRISGFGANQIVDGGTGIDVAEFEFSLDESVTLDSSDSSSIDITANEKTMSFRNVEEFAFAGESFRLDELVDLALRD